MLAKKYRLSRQEINLLKKAKIEVIQGQFFGLVAQPGDQLAKFALIISNKVLAGAVNRVFVKRRLYLAIEKVNWQKTGNFLFLAKKTAFKANLIDLETELKEMMKKIPF